MATPTKPTSNLIRFPVVREKTGMSTTGVYRGMERGDFPKPVRIGPRAVAG
ncbi:AlpA family phage regulatory protein [Halomonas sp. KX33721]|uniref:AlpA family phage regulatory protein n=1 Tax=Halomonas sp. KX33721 TaxID=1819251 RepID=UPI000A9810D6|nr:AlpA family phage regulatory protein [Halomonas sp. KX33721]